MQNKNDSTLEQLYGRKPGQQVLDASQSLRNYFDVVMSTAGNKPFAVFGYGSLMWNPDFQTTFSHKSRLYGYSRKPCIWSTVYRGNNRKPGLVFGLISGGSCSGIAHGIPVKQRAEVIRYLFEREVFQGTYLPTLVKVKINNQDMPCLTFVTNTTSLSYAGSLKPETIKTIVYSAKGQNGTCLQYWQETIAKLKLLGVNWNPGFKLPPIDL